jgi:O-antigen/teichoic acid export membrane protein
LARHYADKDLVAFRALLLKLVGIGVLLGLAGTLGAFVAGREILTILYRPEYAEYPGVFLCLMLAAGIRYVASFLGYGMTAAGYFKPQVTLFAVVVGGTALSCLWLVPSYGLSGAALALITSAVVQALGSTVVVVRSLQAVRRRRTLG